MIGGIVLGMIPYHPGDPRTVHTEYPMLHGDCQCFQTKMIIFRWAEYETWNIWRPWLMMESKCTLIGAARPETFVTGVGGASGASQQTVQHKL